MEREIKFRGKRIDNGAWVVGDLCRAVGETSIYTTGETGILSWSEHIEVDASTVGQFTGLADSDGVDIYEGDLLELIEYPERPKILVFWSDEWAAFRGEYVGVNADDCSINDTCQMTVKIIGNRFDNPELIK